MARIKLDDVIEDLDNEVAQALESAVREVIPGAKFDHPGAVLGLSSGGLSALADVGNGQRQTRHNLTAELLN